MQTIRLGLCLVASAAFSLFPRSVVMAQDSAHDDDVVKSWAVNQPPRNVDRSFLDRLEWKDYPIGSDYVLRMGKIYGKWVAAMQFVQNGKLVMTEYTPPSEYITVLDPATGRPSGSVKGVDANHDNVLEMAFLHEKLDDRNYHLYTVYALTKNGPKLLWKSAGALGDWLRGNNRPAPVQWNGDTNR